ncbi:transposase [Micromonospora sp. M71_S20]|uniref:transposase n=1 Tax=Micromonospora sp. M71_S20 TaxID=592872 RepID=UPI0035155709
MHHPCPEPPHCRAQGSGGPRPGAAAWRTHQAFFSLSARDRSARLTDGNRYDVTQLLHLVDRVPRIEGIRGRPRQRPDRIYADRGYDFDKYRRELRTRGITPVIARRGVPHGSGLGTRRWVVEQAIALLHWFRRLRTRWEIRDDIHEAFRTLPAADRWRRSSLNCVDGWRQKPEVLCDRLLAIR